MRGSRRRTRKTITSKNNFMKTKDGKNVTIEDITAENYAVPAGEERYYHVKIEVKQYNPKTGQKISRPAIQKFGPKMYRAIVSVQLLKMGYEMEVLHDPTEWEKEQAVRIAQMRAAQDERAERDAAEKREEEKAAMKAEILAELKAAGVIPAEPERTGRRAR